MKDDLILDHKRNPPRLKTDEGLDDEALLREAMAKVEPLRGKARTPLPLEHGPDKYFVRDEDIIWPRDLLEQSLKEDEFNSLFDADHMEGGPQEWNQLLLKKLREGHFSIQAELDLHGLSRHEARQELITFIEECSRQGLTCVRIVHGKGKNSRRRVPVLKKQIPYWLSQKRLCRYLIAYSSARPVDGGVGAIYVLLGKK